MAARGNGPARNHVGQQALQPLETGYPVLPRGCKAVEAFGSLKSLLRSRADLDAAIDDDNRFLLALLAIEAAGEAVLRVSGTDDPVLAQFSRLSARGYPVAKKLSK